MPTPVPMPETPAAVFQTLPLELWTVRDLTDAIGIAESAALMQTSARAVYTVRHTNSVGAERLQRLLDAVRVREQDHRNRLMALRNAQSIARARKQARRAG